MSFYIYETTTETKGEVEMTETNSETLKELKKRYAHHLSRVDGSAVISVSELKFFVEQAEQVQDINDRANYAMFTLTKKYEKLRGALWELKVLVLDCDADERVIQPYEVGDIVNQALDGVNHETSKT